MRRIIISALILIAIILTIGFEAKAQTAKRIQFAKGKSSATVKASTGNYGVSYVVRAKGGQKLVLNLTPAAKVGIKVTYESADGEVILLREERGGNHVIYLEEGGDYTIFVGSTDNRPVLFTLTVQITKMTDI